MSLRRTGLSGEPLAAKELQLSKREDVKGWRKNGDIRKSANNNHGLLSRPVPVAHNAAEPFGQKVD